MLYKINCTFIFILLFFYVAGVNKLYSQITNETSDFNYGKELFDDHLYDLALIQFKEYIEKYPSSPKIVEAFFFLAESYFASNQIPEAQNFYIKFIINFPSDKNIPKVYYRIGECYEKINNPQNAITSYLRLINIDSNNSWYFKGLLKAASLSLHLKEYVQTESILKSVINSNPEGEFILQTWLLYSKLYYAEHKYHKSIDILETLLSKSISSQEKGKVLIRLGQIYHHIGFFEKSINQYKQIIDNYDIPEYKQKAFFYLGLINKLKGKDELAIDNFQNSIQFSIDTTLTINALLNSSDIYLHKQDYNKSLSLYTSVLNLDSLNHKAKFGRAISLMRLQKLQSASEIFNTLLLDTSLPISLEKKILLHCVTLSSQNNTISDVIQYFDTFITKYPKDELIDIVLLKKGKICLQQGLWDEGYYSLRRIWKEYPKSRFIPEAKFLYARGLEKVERFTEAKSFYTFIANNYPLSFWEKESNKRIQFINKFIMKDYDNGLLKLSAIIGSDKHSNDIRFQLGKINFLNFKNYKKSINIFQTIINNEKLIQNSDEIYFFLGESYKNLYFKYNKEGYRDSARYYHLNNINTASNSYYSKRSCLSLADLQSKNSIKESYKLIKNYTPETINDSLDFEFIYQRADYLFQLDSLSKALPYYSIIVNDSAHSKYKENSLYKTGKIYYLLNSFVKADSIFTSYKLIYKNGKYLPAVLFYQARINEILKKYNISITNYRLLLDSYFYSVFKDSAIKYLGNIFIKTGNYNNAIHHFKQVLHQDSILQVAVAAGLIENQLKSDNKINYLFNLAKSYHYTHNLTKAQNVYLKYGRTVTTDKKKIKYYTALSTIAEQRSDTLRAVEYLEHLFTINPNDTIAAALGNFYLQLKKYNDAREIFNKGINISHSDSIKCYLSSKIIISLLKEKKIPQADVRIKVFNESFKNFNSRKKYVAEFFLEMGEAYIDEKDFDSALKFLNKIDESHQDLIPQAKFQIGRVYLITNKIDKALDILTYLTENYENHPISYKVYLNLGYHYYRSQQYENAIHALKTASSSSDSKVRKTSLRILIKIYEDTGLTDTALKITRDYINQYPDANDILEQKIKVGTLLMRLYEYDRAIEHLKSLKVYSDSESEARIQYWIAKSYYNMGQFRQSIFEFLKVKYLSQSSKLPWKTTAMYEASKAYIKLQEYDKASNLLEKIIEKEGTTSSMGRFAVEKLQEIKSRNK